MVPAPRLVDQLDADWIILLIVVIFGVLAWINTASPKKWKLITSSFFAFRLGKQTMREDVDLQDRTLIALLVMSTATIALFVYQALVLRGIIAPGMIAWVRLFSGGLALFALQFTLVRALSFLFHADGGTNEYVRTIVLLWIMLGLMLVPITVLLALPHRVEWRAWLLWAGLVWVCVAVLFRWLRALAIGTGEGVPLRYIFIYICAAEILPLALAAHHARTFLP